MPTARTILAAMGLVLSVYAVYVEYKIEHLQEEEEFSALCDIQAIGASCSAVFTLPVGKMLSYFGLVPKDSLLDVPNAVLGMAYYSILLLLPPLPNHRQSPKLLLQLMTCAAFASSVLLAYQLTFVLGDLCILCWTTHVINTSLLYLNVLRGYPKPTVAAAAASSTKAQKKRV